MKIPFLHAYFASRAKAGIRSSMRGYRMLKESGRLEFVMNLKDEIAKTPLYRVTGKASSIFFGAATPDAELVLRQFLVSRVVSYDFNKKVLAALGNGTSTISCPLPPEWRKVIEKHGLTADTAWNKLVWNGYVFLFLMFGLSGYLRTLLDNVKNSMRSSSRKNIGPYTYFQSLTIKNLPHKDVNNKSYDIFSWYSQWEGRPAGIKTLTHSIKGAADVSVNGMEITYMPSAIPSLYAIGRTLSYAGWGIKAFFIALFDLFRSRYWHAVLFREAGMAAQVRLHESKDLAKEYLFHNSNWIYRPLWTYDAEAKGAGIILYFYSSNIELYKLSTGYMIPNYHWHLPNWPCYLVWDEWQADFIRKINSYDKRIQVVGSIWFLHGNAKKNELPENSIVVFDINPLRDTRYHIFVEPLEFLIPEVVNRFLEDIYAVVKEYELSMVLKRKRDIGSLLNTRYKRLVDKLTASDHFLLVDMDATAHELIIASRMVISLPFTSTALIGRELGKPSCFYDPLGLLQQDDKAAHGIKIVSGPEELHSWISAALNTGTSNVITGIQNEHLH